MRTLAGVVFSATLLAAFAVNAAATWMYLEDIKIEDVYAKHAARIDHIISNSVSVAGADKEYSLATTFIIGDLVIRCVEERRFSARDRSMVEETSCYELKR